MNCIVTAGPTYEPLDEVRRLTNFSTGRLGTELANFLSARGHKVALLVGESATYAGPRRAPHVETFTTTADLARRLQGMARHPVDAIFHAAAVSDFSFGKLWLRSPTGGLTEIKSTRKIPTREGNYLVELAPTPKIIARLPGWFPRTRIVGWKFEADGTRADALDAAKRQITECATDLCVVNGPAYGDGFGLVAGNGKAAHLASAPLLFLALEKFLQAQRPAAAGTVAAVRKRITR